MTTKYYAGIGSRETPLDVRVLETVIARKLEELNWKLRSGGAPGSDDAFEAGVSNPDNKEIYLPWPGFNNKVSKFSKPSKDAFKLAAQHHKAWMRLSSGAQKLMARNGHQILGMDLDVPSNCVVCWTPDGCESHDTRLRDTGGTGQAISIASLRGIPIFNLKNDDALARLSKFINFDLEEFINSTIYH